MTNKTFNVYAIPFKDINKPIELIGENLSERSADAVEKMAIMRRGVDTHFYITIEKDSVRDKELAQGLRA